MTYANERRYSDSGRSGTGLAITIAVHVGVAALALTGLGIIKAPTPAPKPIITRHVPDVIKPTPTAPAPDFVEQTIHFTVTEPVIETTIYPTVSGEPIVISEQSASTGTGQTAAADPPPLPPGPTTGARFDKRYAGAAQPPYPSAARRLGEEGTVVVHVRIGRDGRVLASTLAQSSGSPRLDVAALAHALAHWRFTPALKDGVAVEESRDITVRFELALAG